MAWALFNLSLIFASIATVKLLVACSINFFGRSLIFVGIAIINLLSDLGLVQSESYICEFCGSQIISDLCHNFFTGVCLIFAGIAIINFLSDLGLV